MIFSQFMQKGNLMLAIAFIPLLILLDLAVWKFGVDSRDSEPARDQL